MFDGLYTALANAIRAFCPPDSPVPFSPMFDRSPSLNEARSEVNAQASRTCLYRTSSCDEEKIMFSLILQNFWSALLL